MSTHNAPPVVYPLGRSHFQGWFLFAFWVAGLLLVLLWFYATRQLGWRIDLAVAAVIGAGVAARAGWNSAPTGQLTWDGEVWRWESLSYQAGIAEQELSVIADFQQLLLLRLENRAGAKLWLWAERRASPERWLDLRRAVYSPHKSSAASPSRDLLQAEPQLAVAASSPVQPIDVTQKKP